MKTEIYQHVLAKFPRITLNKNVFGIAQLVTCRQTHMRVKQTGIHLQPLLVNKKLHGATFLRKYTITLKDKKHPASKRM